MTTTPRKEAATGDLAQTFSQYVPSLEGRDIVLIRPRYGLVIGAPTRRAGATCRGGRARSTSSGWRG